MADPPPLLLRFGAFQIDEGNARLSRDGRPVELQPKAFAVLCELARRPGQLLTKDALLDAVWGSDVYVEVRTVDVHIGRLRKALVQGEESNPIRTVRSAGYSLDLDG